MSGLRKWNPDWFARAANLTALFGTSYFHIRKSNSNKPVPHIRNEKVTGSNPLGSATLVKKR